jgi:hypothetical protein
MHRFTRYLVGGLLAGFVLFQLSAAHAQTAQSYTIFSAVTGSAPQGPLALGVSVPSSGPPVLQTVNYDPASTDQVWTLLPLLNGPSVLLHRSSGLAVRFGPVQTQLSLVPFVPYDPAFLLLVNPVGGTDNRILSWANSNLMMTVAGSNIYPLTPVLVAPDNVAQGQRWQLVPLAQ